MDLYGAFIVVFGIIMSLVIADVLLMAVFKAMDILDPGRTRTGVGRGPGT